MDTNYTIYCHRNKINNKAYIGQTGCVPYTRRWSGHGVSGDPYRGCRHFQNAIYKYGWDNFEHFAIIENLTLDQANFYEEMLIKLFQTDNPNYGYNIQKGGNNKKLSEETKKLISKNHADFSGKNHPMYGKHHSDATKEKIRKAKIGLKLSDATKEKISQKMKGANNSRAKKVLCIETGQIFNTAKEAALWANRDISSICRCCNGKTLSCGKHPKTGQPLHWKYLAEDLILYKNE